MGKKEQLEELEKQLTAANKKLKAAKSGSIGAVIFLVLGFIFPLFWILSFLLFILVVVYFVAHGRRVNEINLEKAKLK